MLFLQGRHALVSYAAPLHLPEVINCCESFCLDNGAFSVWKAGEGTVDEWGYYNWVSNLVDHPSFDFFIIPDVIDGTEQQNNDAVFRWKNIRGGVPVFHLSEDPSRLLWLAGMFPKVCLGSTSKWPRVGSADWWPLMADFMDTICRGGSPPCKLHGLRMLNPAVFTKLPLHSADSCNAAINGGLCLSGGIHPSLERWQGSERIARRIETHQSAPFWDRRNVDLEVTDLR